MTDVWMDQILKLGLIWARSYKASQESKVQTAALIRNLNSGSDQLAFVYNHLTSHKILEPIETLDADRRVKIWAEAERWAAPGSSPERIDRIARSLWALSYLVKTYLNNTTPQNETKGTI